MLVANAETIKILNGDSIVSNVLMIPMLKLNHPITEAVASIGISKYSRQYSCSKASYQTEITREQNIAVAANLI